MKILCALFAGALLLSACAAPQDVARVEQAVSSFHQQLDAGQFAAIYAGAAEDLKRLSKEQDFVPFLSAVHRKLGASRSATRQSWHVNYGTAGTFITLVYATQYGEGAAQEQFVYRMQAGVPLLAGYHINSQTLVLK